MALDFPSPATNGQLFSAGGQTWRYDGTKWTETTGAASFGDAPSDGHTYGRQNAAWTNVDTPIATATQMAQDNVGRNLIQNPVFTVQQRGTGNWTTNGAYTADRWVMGRGTGGGTGTVSIFGIADGGRVLIGDENAVFGLNYVVAGGSAAGDLDVILQRIENVRRTANTMVTLSFWASPSVAGLKVGVNALQVFGTGGSPSANVQVLTTGIAVTLATTSWTRYSVTFAVPSVAGKTFGTTVGTDTFAPQIFLSSGATSNQAAGNIGVQSGTFNFWGMQLEYGNVATPLDKGGSPQAQLAECQRFYCTGAAYAAAYNTAGANAWGTASLPVTMRAVPSITTVSSAGNANVSAPTWAATAQSVIATCTATATGAFTVNTTFTASADL